MVRKLMKHELIALFRILAILSGAVLILSVLARVSIEISASGGGGTFVLSNLMLILLWVYCCLGLMAAAFVLSIVRFSRTLFTAEGYLTLSLPATPEQILLAKFLSALVAGFVSFLVVLVSLFIVIPQMTSEFFEALPEIFMQIEAYLASDPLMIVELILLVLCLLPTGLLFFYLVACIGQLFTKHRVLVTVLLYFGIEFVLNLLLELFGFPLLTAIEDPHIVTLIAIVLSAGFDVGSFFLIRYILIHRINLIV